MEAREVSCDDWEGIPEDMQIPLNAKGGGGKIEYDGAGGIRGIVRDIVFFVCGVLSAAGWLKVDRWIGRHGEMGVQPRTAATQLMTSGDRERARKRVMGKTVAPGAGTVSETKGGDALSQEH